jgi:tetratricopeptide (TPR) repeat protein
MSFKITNRVFFIFFLTIYLCSCAIEKETNYQQELYNLLEDKQIAEESLFSVINQISNGMQNSKQADDLILFLTDHVNQNPEDKYNPYWLLRTAYTYQTTGAEPIAELYFQRILNTYDDFIVMDKSIHLLCLQNLIQISTSPTARIQYFTKLINEYPDDVNKTELYMRLGEEYKKTGDWNQMLRCYSDFLARSDAAEIQILGMPNAYSTAKNIVDFNNSSKDWTFETLDDLVTAVKRAISRYEPNTLESYKSKVNFFSMSWRQDESQEHSMANFTMKDFMTGKNRIRYNENLN